MPSLQCIILSFLATFSSFTTAVPLKAHQGSVQDIIINKDNTINGTNTPSVPLSGFSAGAPLDISIVNNKSGSGSLNAYITGRDSTGAVVFLSPSGDWYYPDPEGSTSPMEIFEDMALPLSGFGGSRTFTLPGYITAARIWIAEGGLNFYALASDGTQLVEPSFANPADPSAMVDWGFVELTYTADGIWANLSFVDFVSMVLGMNLRLGSGEVQARKGLKAGAVESICKALNAQTAVDGQPWGDMCITDGSGNPLRILAPNMYARINGTAFQDYFDDYIEQVWSHYTTHNLTIDTQSGPGLVNCHVEGGYNLFCDGDNRSYCKPSAADIFGCNSGPFALIDGDNDVHQAVVPRLCAAFNRGTLLGAGGNVQPSLGSDSYYQTSPNNHYSRIVHQYEADGLGYAFSYDDVNPSGENEAGLVAGPDPKLLEIVIGGSS
ncbi:glucanase B [Truncatella angustata]|uniref:Glucanase B n=1 Tax=Truncatella angustata TaxID=152316 RepID=A0A9P8UBH9_9PEZI|nr:glucanase B [Truncatella angustata]KAH6639982.1 glucanase B [Truncatella angustata]